MDVSCPACAAKYTADEEKLRGKTARMRCKACNTAWLVTGPGATPGQQPVSMPPPASMPPASMRPPASMPPPSMRPPASMPPPSMRPPASMPPATSIPSMPPPAAKPVSMFPADLPKAAAVVKKGADREKRDLFAERGLDEGSIREGSVAPMKMDSMPPPSFGFAGTGQRNENSVLFRVDQLAGPAAGRIKTPEPMQPVALAVSPSIPPARGDDEGVIDLNSLSSGPKRPVATVAPLFSEPPMAMEVGSTGARPEMAKPVSKARLIGAIAAAMAFLIVAGFGISIAFKGEEAVARTAPAAVAPPPAPVATAAPTQTATAATDTAVASNDDSDSAKKGKKKRAKGAKANSSSASAAPKVTKAADPCGCKGDFNCILACTAKNGH